MISSDLNKSKEDGRETDPVCMEIVRYNGIQRIIKLHTFDILWKLINSTKKVFLWCHRQHFDSPG